MWFWGGVVLSAREWVRFWQVFVMESVDNVCCNRDRWAPIVPAKNKQDKLGTSVTLPT